MFQKLLLTGLSVLFVGSSLAMAQSSSRHLTDFDGDGKRDIAVFRPSNGTWYIQGSSATYWQYGSGYWADGFGQTGDVPVPGDYDGDGRSEPALFRLSNSTWYVSPTSAQPFQLQFGLHGDVPVPSDYDGDGKTDIAVFRPSNGTWLIQGTRLGYWTYQWGLNGDIPVPGDYDGDGGADAAVFRPSNSTWYVSPSSSTPFSLQFGLPGDIAVPADYDGDGKTDIAVFRPSNSTWYIQGSRFGYWTYQWGWNGDIPVPGDYDGDGRADAAVFRPSNSTWYVSPTSSPSFSLGFGLAADVPLGSSYFGYLTSASPTLQLTNLTHPALSPNFVAGDTYRLTITGHPNQPVSMVQTANGVTANQSFGNTDVYGNLTVDYVEQTSDIGSYTQVWSVGNVQATAAVSFVVGQFGTTGTVTTTDLGQTSDGHMEGVSSLSITNGVVSTYSATTLDYTASLYYDSDTVATLFDEGAQVSQATTPVNVSTAAGLSANATAWHDYDLQTDHYAIAYFISGGYYENPFYWGNSCDAETGDCTVDSGGGYAYWITAAAIYMGSTLADQTNVPQDGSLPPFSDQSVWGILQSGQTIPTGPKLSADTWKSTLLATVPALELAESTYAKSGQTHPLPMFLDLTDETQIAWVQGVSQPSRTRTYLVKDTTGHAWGSTYPPVTIFEKFIKVFGTGGMPDANNPSFHKLGWNRSNKDLRPDGSMDDEITTLFPQPEVDYLQLFWATGLDAPGLVLPSTVASLGLPPLPDDLSSPQIPLFIRDHRSNCKQGGFSLQGIELNPQFVGINGDTGKGTPCRSN